jgi:hypothetical protein
MFRASFPSRGEERVEMPDYRKRINAQRPQISADAGKPNTPNPAPQPVRKVQKIFSVPIPPTPQPTESGGIWEIIWANRWFVAAAIAAIGVIGYLLASPYIGYSAQVTQYGPYARELDKTAPEIPIKEILAADKIHEYRNGLGVSIPVSVTLGSKTEWKADCGIKALTLTDQFASAATEKRKKAVEQFKNNLPACVEKFATYQRQVPAAFLTDNTNGVYPELQAQIRRIFKQAANAKSTRFCILTDADLLNCSPAAERPEDREADMKAMTERNEQKQRSSIALGFSHALAEINPSGEPADIYLFSDLLEFSEMTADFYHHPEILERSNWPELAKTLWKLRPLPNLSGKYIHIYPPPDRMTKIMYQAQAFYKWALEAKEATVKIH